MPVKEAESPVEVTPAEQETPLTKFFDHQRKAFAEAGKALESLIPTAFKEHGEAAFKEILEGYRKLINSTLDEVIRVVEKAKVGAEEAKKKTE